MTDLGWLWDRCPACALAVVLLLALAQALNIRRKRRSMRPPPLNDDDQQKGK